MRKENHYITAGDRVTVRYHGGYTKVYGQKDGFVYDITTDVPWLIIDLCWEIRTALRTRQTRTGLRLLISMRIAWLKTKFGTTIAL